MLSIGKLAAGPGAGRYYADRVAAGREDYYSGEGEAPGRWVGAGGRLLGLTGDVDETAITRLLSSRDPATGAPLRGPLKAGAVAGFDLTFRAPKSVSVLFGIADDAVAAELRDGHEAAVAEALTYLEREACIVRRGHGGSVELPAGGFVAAAFRHRSSRAGDPLLHTHVVVANAARGPDGRWTALYGRPIYAHAKTAGYLYQAVLREELTHRLGLAWQPVERGAADVCGVSREVVEHFSQRRHEILEAMATRGEHSARAAQVATLETRRAKRLEPCGDQRADWRARAAEHGLRRSDIGQLLGRADRVAPSPVDDLADRERLLGPGGLTRQASSFDRRDVVQALAEGSGQGGRVAAIEARADRLLADARVVRLGDDRFSTRDLVALERELLDGAARRRREAAARATQEHVAAATASRPLSDEQRALVEHVVLDDGGVQVVLAPAGTGKTFALDAAREAWQRAGVPVFGCALSARAACELRDQTAIDVTSIARLRLALEQGAELRPDSVLVVDEAGMVGTRDLAALASAAARAPARLVLVGDDRQLPEIDAGGAFAALASQEGAVALGQVCRQGQAWDRDALAQLRSGDVAAFARSYVERGRVVAAPTAAAARTALVDDWWQAVQRKEDALMIAHRRADVADLNRAARTKLREAGVLAEDELVCGSRAFAVGDRVIATRNDRRLGVHNGQAGELTAITAESLHLDVGGGHPLTLPAAYAEAGHLDHGYALTAHRAQGSTVDATFVLGSDELYREWGYTALSRHRHEARFYLSASPTFLNAPADVLTAHEDISSHVARTLRDSRREHLASIRVPTDPRTQELASWERSVAEATERRRRLEEELEATNRLRRGERQALRRHARRAADDIARCASRVDGLQVSLVEQPLASAPSAVRARDPLAGLADGARAPALAREHDLGFDQSLELDL